MLARSAGGTRYLGGCKELRDGEAAGRELYGLALAGDRRPRPVAVPAGIGHARRHLLAQPNEDVTAVV